MSEHEALPGADPQERLVAALSNVQEIAHVRRRMGAGSLANRLSAAMLGGGYLLIALLGPAVTHPDAIEIAALVALTAIYAVAFRTEFAAAAGSAVPTQPVLVAMVLTIDAWLVPLAVLVGLMAGAGRIRGDQPRLHTLAVRATSGWHCVGPVLVISQWHDGPVHLTDWPVLAVALGAQYLVDATVAAIRCAATRTPIRGLVRPMSWTFAVDALLAVVGLCMVVAAEAGPLTSAGLVATPVLLVRLLARDRTEHLEQAVALGEAFETVREEARVDPLTGLANRRGWTEACETAHRWLDEATGRRCTVEVVMADLDHLKRANDTFGHEVGDALIQATAQLLRRLAPASATVARLGGDEFGLVWHCDGDANGPVDTAEVLLARIRHCLGAGIDVHGLTLSISLGAASTGRGDQLAATIVAADELVAADKLARRAQRS